MDPYFDDWQEAIIKSTAKRILLCKGRQIGGTTGLAKKAADRLAKKKGETIIVVSITEDQAQLVIIMVLAFLEKYYPKSVSKKKTDTTKSQIKLRNGSIIKSRPVGSTGASIRGFTGGILWLNEGSRLPEFVFEASKAILLTTNGDIWMDSTPFGKKGYFYNCFLNKNDIWEVFYKTSEEVIENRVIRGDWTEERRAGGIKLLADEKKEMTELQYGQEYLGLFLEELRQYFSDDLLHKTCILKRLSHTPKENNYLGVDIARMGGDECAYEILSTKNPTKIHQIENITKKKQFTTQTEDDIHALNYTYLPDKIGIDAGSGSLGVGIYDRLIKDPRTKRKVVAMNNRKISLDRDGKAKQRIFKEDMYENLLSMMEKGEILLLDDDTIFTSLKSVQWELREVAGQTKVKIFGNYTHIAEGLIRAAWLAKKEKSKNIRILAF